MAFDAWASPSWAQQYSARYDRAIQRAVKDYRPGFPWQRGKAQLIAESNLDPTVCSSVGACGIAQFMPGTWDDVTKHGDIKLRFDAGTAINAWGIEMSRLEHQWRAPRPDEDRWSFTESSYNAGLGWILQAQSRCGNPPLWDDVMRCLPDITGPDHSKETIGYTLRIRSIWKQLLGAMK